MYENSINRHYCNVYQYHWNILCFNLRHSNVVTFRNRYHELFFRLFGVLWQNYDKYFTVFISFSFLFSCYYCHYSSQTCHITIIQRLICSFILTLTFEITIIAIFRVLWVWQLLDWPHPLNLIFREINEYSHFFTLWYGKKICCS